MKNQVVVRFAPSPTGYLHVGGARTAIFNWLYARQNKGRFILRIEDTDDERSSSDSITGIVEGLKWLGLLWDEGPNFQSDGIKKHLDAAEKLIKSGHAYRCFCSAEDIQQKRQAAIAAKKTFAYDGTCRHLTEEQIREKLDQGLPYAIRLKVPKDEGSVVFKDKVCGRIEKKHCDIDDFIIVRSNGKPLYILSNAVDDISDGVTHIIRGQDGLANTPKQILLYQALNAPLPVFAHMSLALDPKKVKISKRKHGESVAIHFYRDKGFLPWAMVNFLVLLGWSTSDATQIFSEQELLEAFNLEGISRTNCIFNIHPDSPKFFTDPKALNINAHYIRTMPLEDLLNEVKQIFETKGLWQAAFETSKKDWFSALLNLVKNRCQVLTDFCSSLKPFITDDFTPDAGLVHKYIREPELGPWLRDLIAEIKKLPEFTADSIETLFKAQIQVLTQSKEQDQSRARSHKPAVLIRAVRVALCGKENGPDFVQSLVLLGKNNVIKRLSNIDGSET